MASIRINGDVSGLRRSILDVSKLTKDLGKNKITLLSPETQKFFDGVAAKEIDKVKGKIEQTERIAAKLAQRMNDTGRSSGQRVKDEQKYLEVLKKEGDLLKNMEEMRPRRPGFIEGAGKAARGLPGVGKVADAVGGLGWMGGLGMLAGGAAIGAGAYGVSRLATGYGKYTEGIDSRIKLMGRGADDTNMSGENRKGFSNVGMNEQAVREARLQSMDIFGKEGSDQKSVLGRAQFATNYGVDLSTLQGAGAGMQAQVGTKGASRDIMKLQASLQASEIKDAIGPYLETSASLLADIRQNGQINSGEVLGLISQMSKLGNSPQRAAQQISGFNNAVQNSSGETNAFMQMAFNKAGIGGGTMGGTQAAIRSSGIFGLNLNDYKGMSPEAKKNFSDIGAEKGSDKRIGAILDQSDQLFGRGQGKKQTKEQMLAQDRFMMPMMGAKSEAESEDMMGMFRKAQGNPKAMDEFEKKLKDNTASPEEKSLSNLNKIATSQEGSLRALQTIRDIEVESMGKMVAPAVMKMQGALFHIDEMISSVYKVISGFIPGMSEGDNGAIPSSATKSGGMDLKDYLPQTLLPEAPGRFTKGLQEAEAKAQTPEGSTISSDAIGQLLDQNKQLVDLQKQQTTYSKRTSQAVARPRGSAPATGRIGK